MCIEANFNVTSLIGNNSSVIIDRVNGKFHGGEDIFRTIYNHISNNFVQVNIIITKIIFSFFL